MIFRKRIEKKVCIIFMDFQQNPLLYIYIINSFLLCGLLATYNQLINHAQKSRKLPLNL